MKLKPYSKYKDSEVQWIGEIPEEWKFHKLKFMLSSLESGSRENDESAPLDKGAFSIGGEHINWNGTLKLDHERFVSFEYYSAMNRGKIQENDVLLVKDGATIGKTALVIKKPFDKMAVNEHVFILRPNKKISPKLLYYLIDSDSGFRQIKLTETGSAQGGINTEFANKTLFSINENSNEQEKITDFLDSKTSQISKTIEADKRLIELLKEKRTALINHVVTKGLNPKSKMKDSGIEWIGEVPEGWEVRKIRHCFDIIGSGTTPSSSDESYYPIDDEEGISWINTGDLNDSHLIESSKRITKKALMDFSALKIFPKNSLIIAMYGATIGKTAIVDIESTYNQACCVLNKSKKMLIEYAHYWFLAKKEDIIALSYGGGQPNISQDVVKRVKITVPSIDEQTQISSYLDKATSKIDQTIKKIEEKIELLEEFKKSLIHHIVTGKVDVREAVA